MDLCVQHGSLVWVVFERFGFALSSHAPAAGNLGESADGRNALFRTLSGHALRKGFCIFVDACRIVPATVADILHRAVGIAPAGAGNTRFDNRAGFRRAVWCGRTRAEQESKQSHTQRQTHYFAAHVSRKVTARLNTGFSAQ